MISKKFYLILYFSLSQLPRNPYPPMISTDNLNFQEWARGNVGARLVELQNGCGCMVWSRPPRDFIDIVWEIKGSTGSSIRKVVEGILVDLRKFNVWDVSGNNAAHILARQAKCLNMCNVWIEDTPPPSITDLSSNGCCSM